MERCNLMYLVIGSGRMASHFCYYLRLLNLPYRQWSRKDNTHEELVKNSKKCSHVLFLISDGSIEQFLGANSFLVSKCCVHFSGMLVSSRLFGAHPLMTFSNSFYNVEVYSSIPFVLEEGIPSLSTILPGLPNREFRIEKKLKPLYHALIVMANNFTTMLWQFAIDNFNQEMSLPQEVINPIIMQTMNNIIRDPKRALTGPLVRNDRDTVSAHLDALENTSYKEVYQAFVDAFSHLNLKKTMKEQRRGENI